MEKTLYTIYLKQELANQSLLINAISQLLVKIIYSANKPITFEQICEETKTILNSTIKKDHILEALNELVSNGNINSSKDVYKIRKNYKKKIESQYNIRKECFENAIETYFKGTSINLNQLKNWFEDTNISFFCEYSKEWIEDLRGRSEKRKGYISTFKALHNNKIFKQNRIPYDERSWLREQYIRFLRSNDPGDQLLMWDYATSLFASQLISANLYVDKGIKDLFQDSKMVLDTNILMYLDLEKDKFAESYKKIEEIFVKLSVEPIYFLITKDEYRRAINYKIESLGNIVDKYDISVLKESSDSFILTALERGCIEKEHFQTFFDEISFVPKYFNSTLELIEYYDGELEKEINKYKKQRKLQNILNEIYLRKNIKDKKESSLNHDAGLIAGTKYMRKNQKVWILTRDGTVHTYSIENTKESENPIAINLNTLISLLSINDGGLALEADDMMPLFSTFIKNNLIIERNIFKLEDLTRMYEIQSQITNLPKEDIISIAKEINHDRIKGISEKKIALKLQRKIQSYKIQVKDELSVTKENLISAKRNAEILSSAAEKRKLNYFKKRKREIFKEYSKEKRVKIVRTLLIQIGVLLCITVGLLFLIYKNFSELNFVWSTILAFIINVAADAFSYKKLIKYIFENRFNKKIDLIEKKIEKEWDDLLGNENLV